jgi:hypothetical protein
MRLLRAGYSSTSRRGLIGLVAALAASLLLSPVASALTWHDFIDYNKLKSRVGSSLPIGAGVPISQVEAPAGAAYFVDGANTQFNGTLDPSSTAVTFIDGSGNAAAGNSNHATSVVGAQYYGDTFSLAPGANTVTLYEANDWLNNVIKFSGALEPVPQNFRVQNHSWIHSFAPGGPVWAEHPSNVNTLRRYDYLIDTANNGDGMTAVVGLNNDTTPLPYLLAHSYNAIAVGRTDGIHSSGLTLSYDGSPPDSTYGPGRSKPDIVAPLGTTSVATAAVSSAATMLYQSAGATDAAKNEVMKAVLLAGASKEEFPGWSRTPTQPLDDVFGAGELNVYNSYLVQLGGKHAGSLTQPSTLAGSYGWDYQNRKGQPAIGDIYYNFEIPEGSSATNFSAVLSWNLKVTDTNSDPSVFTGVHSLQNLDMAFFRSTNGFLAEQLDSSVSTVDNVEHVYVPTLAPGVYTLKVSGAANWDFGLAWRMSTQFDETSADFDENGVVDGSDFLTWQRNLGRLVNATHAQGDADGDGDVDVDDLSAWKLGLMPVPQAPAALAVAGVPEPGTMAMAVAAAALGLAGWRLRFRRPVRECQLC